MPLHGVEGVAGHVFARDEPGGVVAACAFQPTDAKPLPLADGVEAQSDVAADFAPAVGVHDGAGLRVQVAREKFAERPLADEADAGGVFFARVGQADFFGQPPHLALVHVAKRKEAARELRLCQAVQEVALVLAAVHALEQFKQAAFAVLAHARVVAGGDFFRAKLHGVVKKGFELDFGVAEHVWVGRASSLVFVQKLREHALAVVGGEVDVFQLDAYHVGGGGGVNEVLAAGAVFVVIVAFPVLHEDARDLVPGAVQQPGGHSRIHAAGHADHDVLRLDAFLCHAADYRRAAARVGHNFPSSTHERAPAAAPAQPMHEMFSPAAMFATSFLGGCAGVSTLEPI